ncbi:NADH:flavin oxidoreductase/NADH oxidase [Thelonectria olida]|uniref:NADH:flavin oxidoreductase/NADH oxidase n=1 Tax=Thelonectria olida TaxID=1576542 RepID=A0A9P8VYA3_9HYPO|nr:NADH:flavin oxidoreductase/NADH oxidase [Thelonectria olida]
MTASKLHLAQPLTLKCGLTLPNRLVKAAMAENMADKLGLPTKSLISSYGPWADGGWGMIITGNVQVDLRYLGGPLDVAFNDTIGYNKQLEAWKPWAATCLRNGTPTIVQVNHPGRQSPVGAGTRGFFEKSIAPSAIPMDFGGGFLACAFSHMIFGTPKEMSTQEIKYAISRFVDTARLSAEAGFSGAELHAAHGYLLAQFLSNKSNKRTDEYGGSPAARTKIVLDIISGIRAVVPKSFCLGIKLNSVDHQSPTEFSDCMEQLKLITAAGVDFVEVSGGTYEKPTMMLGVSDMKNEESTRTKGREAFFLDFAAAVRKEIPDVPLMVTGGFRSRQGIDAAIVNGGCEMAGIARPSVLNPKLPKNVVLNPETQDQDARLYARRIRQTWFARFVGAQAIGASAETSWYGEQIRKMAKS